MPYSKIEAISEIEKGFRQHDSRFLRKVNDRAIEMLALEFDKDFYNLAILSYCLSKIAQKPRYWENNPKIADISRRLSAKLHDCSLLAAPEKAADLSRGIFESVGMIDLLDSSDRRFVRQPVEKAKLKIAATLYAQGFSLGSASELTGMDKREILSYAGRTMMFDRLRTSISISERVRNVRKIFEK